MNRALIRSLSVSLALFNALAVEAANHINLLGCWRSQNMNQYYSDGRIIRLNRDCVSEISLKEIRSECQSSNGSVNNSYAYEITAPGRYVITVSGGNSAAKQPPQQRPAEYVVDGEGLMVTTFPPKQANAHPPIPDRIVGLAVRVNAASGTCHPRGPSTIRVGGRSVSSLLLTVPKTYVPVIKDPFGPFANPHLQQAINFNFLIGQFVRAGSEKAWADGMLMPGGGYVLVVEDYKIGSRPMKPADFRQFKASIKQEIGQDKVSCEDDKRICFSTALSGEGWVSGQPSQILGHMTTEFVNLKGRVAIIYALASGGTAEGAKAARRSADIFAEQIVRDNP